MKTLESPLDCKEIQPVHSEGDQPWDFFGRNDAKAETPVPCPPHAKSWLIGKDSFWEGLGAGGEGDDRAWDSWMASLIRWTWVWVNSRSLWRTGRPGMLRFMESQRVGHDWATELNWTSNEYSGLISFKIDWLDLLAVQGTLESLHHHSSKASFLRHSAFFTVQFSHPYMTTGKTIALTRWTFVECRVPKNIKERQESLPLRSMQRNRRNK